MPARIDGRGRIFYRKQVKHPLTGEKVTLHSYADKEGRPFKKKSEANDAERKAIEELRAPARGAMPTFDDWFHGRFWTEWVLGGPRGANSPSEQEAKRLIYDKWLKTFFGTLPLDRIDVPLINQFRASLRGRRKEDGTTPLLSEKTINNILAVLSTPLQYAAKAGILMRAPHVGVAKVERPEIEFIDFEEVADLVRAAREDERPELVIAVLLAYEAGLRIGEIRALQWDTVDMRARTITVVQQVRTVAHEHVPAAEQDAAEKPVGKYAYRDALGKPKGRRRRVVMMSPALHDALRDRVRVGYVVAGEGGKPLTKEMVRCGMERIAERAGLAEKVSAGWHIGRHTFATHAALLGVNPWVLQEWMGHQRSEETQLYADVARAHGRPIPAEILSAGADDADPNRRVLAQLSARLTLASGKVAADLLQKGGAP